MHALALVGINQQTKYEVRSFTISKDIMRQNLKGSRNPDHAPFKVDFSDICWNFIQPIGVQTLITLASAVPEIWLMPTKI